jgi:hypothetical protein
VHTLRTVLPAEWVVSTFREEADLKQYIVRQTEWLTPKFLYGPRYNPPGLFTAEADMIGE